VSPSFKKSPKIGEYRKLIMTISAFYLRPLKKRCRILPAGGLGLSPSLKKSPKIGGYRGLIKTINVIDAIPGNIFL
jgi:hypothetical protein